MFNPSPCTGFGLKLFEKKTDGVFIVHRALHTVKERQDTPNQE